jgi:hypothetical protein
MFPASGTTCGGTQVYSPPSGSGSCTGYAEPGPEVLCQLTLPGGSAVDILVTSEVDNAVYVLTDCGDTAAAGCVAGADGNYQPPFSETLTLSNPSSAPATYYIVLDTWQPNDCGAYAMDITP